MAALDEARPEHSDVEVLDGFANFRRHGVGKTRAPKAGERRRTGGNFVPERDAAHSLLCSVLLHALVRYTTIHRAILFAPRVCSLTLSRRILLAEWAESISAESLQTPSDSY